MDSKIKKAIVRAAGHGFNIPELGLYFCNSKDKVSYKEYRSFVDWAKGKADFYYWLRSRLNAKYARG